MQDQTNTFDKKFFFFLVVISMMLMSSCSGLNINKYNPFQRSAEPEISQPAVQLTNAADEIKDSAKDIIKSTDNIQESSEKINEKSSSVLGSVQDPETRNEIYTIQDESNKIASESTEISRKAKDILNEHGTVLGAAKAVESVERDLRAFEEEGAAEARRNLYKMIVGMAAMGGLIIIGGIAMAFFNPKMGAMVAGFGLIITTIAAAGTFYLKWIAMFGFALLGIGLLITLGFLVKNFWYARRLQQSHDINIDLIDEMKDDLPEDARDEYFGDDGIMDQRQSKSTRDVVKRSRKRKKQPRTED